MTIQEIFLITMQNFNAYQGMKIFYSLVSIVNV